MTETSGESELSQLFHLGSKKYYSSARAKRMKGEKSPSRPKPKSINPKPDEYITYLVSRRRSKRLTQQAVAKKLRTSQSYISYFETGRDNPTLKFIDRYCRAIGVELILRISDKKLVKD
ncbi:MAG: helix-turn-helix transcriptional regulator [Patescibacteria group bacterium]